MPRRRRAPRALLVATAALAVGAIDARPARAKVTAQATGTVTAGWTDNILNAPDVPVPGGAERQTDVFFQLQPGAVLSQDAPRLMQRLAYTFTADLFARHSEANSYSNMLAWTGNALLSASTRLSLSAVTQQGRISTFTLNQSSGDATVNVLTQSSATNFFSQNVDAGLEETPIVGWRFSQALSFRAFVPIDRGRLPDTYSVTGEVGAERTFRSDSVGGALRANWVAFNQPRDPLTDVALGFDQRQVLTTLLARWRHDWSRSWNTAAELGVIAVVGTSSDPTAPTATAWQPSALASLRWVNALGVAELHYAHTATPNSFIGATIAVDEAALQGTVPLLRNTVIVAATVAYQHAHLLPLASTLAEENADLAMLDVSVGWQPIPELRVFARYSFFDQFGEPQTGGVPPILPQLTRSVLMIGATATWPALAAVRAPVRSPSRVDETDQAAFAEPHATPAP